MNAFSKIDMAEVLRLTRAGQLMEATARLRGGSVAAVDEEHARSEAAHATNPAGRLFPLPGVAARLWPTEADAKPADPSAVLAGFRQTLQALRDRSPAFNGLDPGRRSAAVAIPPGARFEERIFANGAGSQAYKLYVPSSYKGQSAPLVVMMHGCTQDPDDFAAGTRMNELAEEQTFLVAYPRQPQSANAKKCWNWYDPDNQQRDAGEPSLIAGLAREIVGEFSADRDRVYVAGLSAGGAAAAVLAATHPDVFAAVGVHSGLACGAARDMPSAFAAMAGRGTMPARGAGTFVPTIVFHGDADRIVHPVNAEHVAAQATPPSSLAEVVMRSETPDGRTYTRTVRLDASNREMLEHWVLHKAGHAWSGGSANGSFTDPRGPDASREMIRFFLQHRNEQPGRRV